jgi:glycosyltransferase involved in cell wall biosynthesis
MNKPLRVAYINHTGEMGGAEHLLVDLLRQLPSGEIIPFLICGQNGRFVFEARKLGIQTEVLNFPKFYSTSWVWGNRKILNPVAVLWNGANLFRAAGQLVRTLQKKEIDIIQTNTVLAHLYGGMAARALRIPCVWYFHDLVEHQRLAGLIAFVWRILAFLIPSRIVADSNAVLHQLTSQSNGIVIYPCSMGAKNEKINTIISLLERLDLPPNSILVGTLGRIAYVKGLDVLIDAAKLVVAQNQNVHFIIFGGALFGEENYKIGLEKKVDLLLLSNNWHWMGYDELAHEYLKEVNFVVFPSRREAFGLTLVEAGYSGKASIAAKVGGIPEIIEHGKTGILVPSQNPRELASAIIKLCKDPAYTAFLGENAKASVKSKFNEKRYISEFLSFYASFNT